MLVATDHAIEQGATAAHSSMTERAWRDTLKEYKKKGIVTEMERIKTLKRELEALNNASKRTRDDGGRRVNGIDNLTDAQQVDYKTKHAEWIKLTNRVAAAYGENEYTLLPARFKNFKLTLDLVEQEDVQKANDQRDD